MVNLIIFVIVLWILALHNKLNSLSNEVKFLRKNIEKYITAQVINQTRQTVTQNPNEESKDNTIPTLKTNINKEIQNSQVSSTITKTVQKSKKQDNYDFQNIFLGNIFNKIGAIAIITAIIIFVKLVSPLIIITPLMKLTVGFLFGLAIIITALSMNKNDNLKNYSEVLLGTGFADLFITTFCGYSLFNVFNTFTVIFLGILLLLSTYIIADKMKTFSMPVIGLIGGYLTPFCSGAGNNLILAYLIFLNMVSLIFTLKNKNLKSINIVNLIITMLIMSLTMDITSIHISYPIFLWLVYLIYDLIRDKENIIDNSLSWVNYGILTFFTYMIFKDTHFILGYIFGITAIVYLALSVFSRFIKSDIFKTYEYYILLNIWFFIFFTLTDIQSVISWAIIALILSLISQNNNFKHLENITFGYFLTTITAILLARYNGNLCITTQYNPIFNIRTLIFIIPIICILVSAHLYKDNKKSSILNLCGISLIYLYMVTEISSILSLNNMQYNKFIINTILGIIYSVQMKKMYITTKNQIFNGAFYIIGIISFFSLIFGSYNYDSTNYIAFLNLRCAGLLTGIAGSILVARWSKSEIYKYISVFLGFLLFHFEACESPYNYLISLSWVLYSGIITILGIIKNKNFLKYSGIILIIMTVLRIFIYDLAKVDMIYKLIISLALGLILMLTSYMYSKGNKNE